MNNGLSGQRINTNTDILASEQTQINLSTHDAHRQRALLSRAQVDYWIQYRSIRKKYILRQTQNIFEYVIAITSTFTISLIYLFAAKSNYSIKHIVAIFGLIWSALYLSRAIRLIITLRDGTLEYAKKKHIWTTMFKNLLLVASHLQISVFFLKHGLGNIIAIIIPLLLALFCPFLVFNKATNSCFSFIRTIKFVVGVFRIAIIIVFLLKETNKITSTSPIIYLPLWLLLFVIMLAFLFISTVVVFELCATIKGKTLKEESMTII